MTFPTITFLYKKLVLCKGCRKSSRVSRLTIEKLTSPSPYRRGYGGRNDPRGRGTRVS